MQLTLDYWFGEEPDIETEEIWFNHDHTFVYLSTFLIIEEEVILLATS